MPLRTKPRSSPQAAVSVKSEAAVSAIREIRIIKSDFEKGIVYGLVYEPNALDSHGELMLPDDVQLAAHRFLTVPDLSQAIDTNHDGFPNGCYPVESFVARKGDPDYPEGGWVIGVKCSPVMLARVKNGDINGFSFDCMVKPVDVEVSYDLMRDHVGLTEPTNDHVHTYVVEFDDMGRIKSGKTDTVDGHYHDITRASVTQRAHNHNHRFFL